MTLTERQQRFVDAYLLEGNATQAAIKAGYKPTHANVTGPRMLTNVGVAQALAAAQEKRAHRNDLTQDWLLRQMLTRYGPRAIEEAVCVVAPKMAGRFPPEHWDRYMWALMRGPRAPGDDKE